MSEGALDKVHEALMGFAVHHDALFSCFSNFFDGPQTMVLLFVKLKEFNP